MDLLGKDYYSQESAFAYWSVSQFKAFKECEAKALAELKEAWASDRDDTALLVGNYVHSKFESEEAHKSFINQNSDKIFKKNGTLYAPFEKAQEMISALENDQDFKKYYVGEKEVAITGEFAGVTFKGKIDCLNVERGYFVDIKTTKGPIDDQIWLKDEEGRNYKEDWFVAYGYILQMAAYRDMLQNRYGKPFTPIIYAVTKETPPDTQAIVIQNDEAMQDELDRLAQVIERLDKVKKGQETPKPCRKCDYCRANKLTQRVRIY